MKLTLNVILLEHNVQTQFHKHTLRKQDMEGKSFHDNGMIFFYFILIEDTNFNFHLETRNWSLINLGEKHENWQADISSLVHIILIHLS